MPSCRGEQGDASGLWYVGVLLSVLGSVGTNLGVNLQKLSFLREAKTRSRVRARSYARQPLWLLGLLLVVAGSALDFVALGFLPQSLATPVGGSTMVANVLFSSLLLHEKFGRGDALGTALVLLGICLVAAFASRASACYTVHELVALYRAPLFLLYAALVALACAALYALSRRMERVLASQGRSSRAYRRFAKLHAVSYPALSGLFGAQSVLFAKSAAELLKTSVVGGANQFASPTAVAIALAMLACVLLQLHWLAQGLQHFDAVFVVPVFQCFFISVSILGGGVYFREFRAMRASQLAMFALGVAVTLAGVFQLARRDMTKLPPRGRLRAAVAALRFIRRCQTARGLKARWETSPTPLLGVKHASPRQLRGSKASVVPVDVSDQ